MSRTFHRAGFLAGLLSLIVVVSAATRSEAFTGGYFKASDGTSTIGLDFDTTGALNVYVDGQAFSKSSWEAKADTMSFGPVTGPEGYNCTGGATYLWALAENRLSFSRVSDDCEVRLQALTGLAWTKG